MNDFYPIKTIQELEIFIKEDKKACFGSDKISFEKKLRSPFKTNLFKFLKLLRNYEYLCYKRDSNKNTILSKFISLKIKLIDIKKNRLSLKIGVEIKPFHCGKGVRICHPNVIINGHVGDCCIFHGNNVVGNKKTGDKDSVPELGKNVDVGVNAIIIGNVVIADNCSIGAGAVVTKTFASPGIIIAGVPAKKINGEK